MSVKASAAWGWAGVWLVATVLLSGCGEPDTDTPAAAPAGGTAPAADLDTADDATAEVADDDQAAAADAPAADADADDGSDGTVKLNPANTTIQFVGIHVGDKPDPRTGTFGDFSGTAEVTDGALQSVSVEIDTASLETDIEKLTNHLKSPDFFNVNEHPKASFVSSKIEPAGDGKVTITGDLTLLGQTKTISFDAEVVTDEQLQLKAEFPIDRTEFGMDYGTDKVDKEVAMTVMIGRH